MCNRSQGKESELISVIIPTYNRVHVLPRAIECVLNQSYANIEVIVIDDGSTDGTDTYMNSVQDNRVRYVKLPQNKGPAGARNVGAKMARGEYLAFQDSDTIWEQDKLRKQMQKFEEKEYVLVYHPYSLAGKIYPSKEIPTAEKEGDIFRYLLYCPLVGTPTMLLKKSLFEQVNGFAEELRCLEDFELSLRISKLGKVGFIDEVMLYSDDTKNSVSKNYRNEIKAIFYIMTEFFAELEEDPFAKKLLFNRISKLATENKQMELFYEGLQLYLKQTNQAIEDMMSMYEN